MGGGLICYCEVFRIPRETYLFMFFGIFLDSKNQRLKKIRRKIQLFAFFVKPFLRCIIAIQFNKNDLTPIEIFFRIWSKKTHRRY